jgi:hypothetical protein
MLPSIVTEYREKVDDVRLRAGIGTSTSGTAGDGRSGVEQSILWETWIPA